MVPIFKSLVRPILEYANSVYANSLRKNIDAIECVERFFTKCISSIQFYIILLLWKLESFHLQAAQFPETRVGSSQLFLRKFR